jgi:adenylate kinase
VDRKGPRLLLVGPPGAGKGTQGRSLAKRFAVPYVSAGDLLRNLAADDTETGRKIAGSLNRGELVPDDLIINAVRDALAEAAPSGGFVLEGFPRTTSQAERSDAVLRPDAVIHLVVPDDIARARVARRTDSRRSDDADEAVVERRLQRFHDEIEPILQHYADRGVLIPVEAERSPDAVHEAIVGSLAKRGQEVEDDDLAHR